MFRISFLVDDKYVTAILHALANRTRELEVVPVLNAKPAPNGKVYAIVGNLPELAMAEVRKQGIKEVNAKSMRDIVEYLGGNPNSYYHVIRNCIRDGALKKNQGKGRTSKVTYSVQSVK